MRTTLVGVILLLTELSTPARPAQFPEAAISNGLIEAKLYLPDAEKGYYRGTRFDWSGVIHSLTCKGRQYFGEWFGKHDPLIHDGITGPVEEFRTNDKGLGYDEAPAGGRFIRIGVGEVEKPPEDDYEWTQTCKVVNPGEWKVTAKSNWIEFEQTLTSDTGYGYVYAKRITLPEGKPVMLIEHTLRNTGGKTIETNQYNHNFFTIDRAPTGPDFSVGFHFTPRATQDLQGLAAIKGNELVFQRELKPGESVFSALGGHSGKVRDYDITIENAKTGTGVRITSDIPLAKLNFWAIRTTICPEPFIDVVIAPGQQKRWTYRYEFTAK